jgi:hypothetical protein
MKFKNTLAILSLAIFLSCSSYASIFIGTDNKNFQSDAKYDDDIFIGGNKISFQSEIAGDLVGGSQELDFSGTSLGNINWAAKWIIIKGPVDRSVRCFAQTIDINAPIGRNLIAFGQNINVGPGARIGKDALISGGIIEFEGYVRENLKIYGEHVIIAGTIAGNLDIQAKELEIKPNTVIEGDLTYKSPEKTKIEDSVIINGQTTWTKSEKDEKKQVYHAFEPITYLLYSFLIFNFICSLIIFIVTLLFSNSLIIPGIFLALIVCGIVIISLNKNMALKTVSTLEKRFWISLGLGLLLILLFPLATILTTVTIIGMPLGLLIIFAFGLLGFAGAIFAAQFAGGLIVGLVNADKKRSWLLNLIIGIIVLAGLILIPVIGWIVALLTLASGLGALILSFDKFKDKSLNLTSTPTINE